MPIPLPDLDDRNYEQLLDEIRTMIPGYIPQWTNWNPSDPGVAVMELFAWLADQILYRINRLPENVYVNFLKIMNVELQPGESIESGILRVRNFLDERYRAITSEDFELLALDHMTALDPDLRGRVIVMTNVDLEFKSIHHTTIADVTKEGHISLIVIPRCGGTASSYCVTESLPTLYPTEDLLRELKTFLDDRRLIATTTHLMPPEYLPIGIQASVVLKKKSDVLFDETQVLQEVEKRIRDFYDVLEGGPDGTGWPQGRSFYRSELYQVMESVSELDHVVSVSLTAGGVPVEKEGVLKDWELISIDSVALKVVGYTV